MAIRSTALLLAWTASLALAAAGQTTSWTPGNKALNAKKGHGLRASQPTDVRAVHRSGQTFISWTEKEHLVGESYKLYRASFPFKDVRKPGVVDLGFQTWEQSGELFSDRVVDLEGCEHGLIECGRPTKPIECFRPRFVERHWIPDGQGGAREVPHGEGLFVWTLDCADFNASGCQQSSGSYWYAVTTVDEFGFENPIVTSKNRVAVDEGLAEPLPVEVPREYVDCSKPGYCPTENLSEPNPAPPGVHVFVQYMDLRRFNSTFAAPNALNCWWGEDPAAVHVRNARQYAFVYTVAEPDPLLGGCSGPWPVVLELHSHGGVHKHQLFGIAAANAYSDGCALKIQAYDVGDTWWYGFSESFDYRTLAEDCPSDPCDRLEDDFPPLPPYERVVTSGPIVNYTEARLLRMIHDLTRAPLPGYPVDPNRVYVEGNSMGGSGALSLALRYPNVFAAAAVGKPMTDFDDYLTGVAPEPDSDFRFELARRWGAWPALAATSGLPLLETASTAPAGWAAPLAPWDGTQVYAWMDHVAQMKDFQRRRLDSAPFGVKSGWADDVLPYPTQGQPFFQSTGFGNLGRTWGGVIDCGGHGGQAHDGMPPSLTTKTGNPSPASFADHSVVRDETVPGFSELTGGNYPAPPTTCCSAPCNPNGPRRYYHDLIWSSSWFAWDTDYGPPRDEPGRWEISVKWLGSFSPPPKVTIVPRRVQQFLVDPNTSYRWTNVELGTGEVIQPPSPPFQPLPSGELQIQGVQLSPQGNRVIVVRL